MKSIIITTMIITSLYPFELFSVAVLMHRACHTCGDGNPPKPIKLIISIWDYGKYLTATFDLEILKIWCEEIHVPNHFHAIKDADKHKLSCHKCKIWIQSFFSPNMWGLSKMQKQYMSSCKLG